MFKELVRSFMARKTWTKVLYQFAQAKTLDNIP
jgi:hypothetical protein